MPQKTLVQINEILQDIINSETDNTQIKYELHLEEIPPIDADAVQLKQALKNIIINAKEAIPLSGVINISAKISSEKISPFIKISIRDSGIGIPKENLAKIFDPYYSTKTRANSKGSGLGLSISYSIIKNHGGNIFVDSQVGKGTTFDIFIPLSAKARKTDLGYFNTDQ
jgi:signal transduction histidine kinase